MPGRWAAVQPSGATNEQAGTTEDHSSDDRELEALAEGEAAEGSLPARSETPNAMFVVWDEPALLVPRALEAAGLAIPIVTVDLGLEVAVEIARGRLIKGGGAQLPFDQGSAEATVANMALAGDAPPPWVALPALAVTQHDIQEAYAAVWHEPAPRELTGRHDA